MVNSTLISRIQKVLADKELSTAEIMELLKKKMTKGKTLAKEVTSFTSNQIAQLMRRKHFEKCGWHKKHNSNLWRNKNVMDRKIQTK